MVRYEYNSKERTKKWPRWAWVILVVIYLIALIDFITPIVEW